MSALREAVWGVDDIPDQSGRVAVITGGNGGLGWETAAVLAEKGAHVVLGCRNAERGASAMSKIVERHAAAKVSCESLDLASLASIRSFAERVVQSHPRIDVLINNAGVMAIPQAKTVEGYEMQFGANHLGHFALTGGLMPALRATPGSRIVNVSSLMHRFGQVSADDFLPDRSYSKWGAYNRSKLANLLFTFELDRRLRRAVGEPFSPIVTAAHPGYAATDLQGKSATLGKSRLWEVLMKTGNRIFAQSAAMGALPTLRAATDPSARSGDYFGPSGFLERAGPPRAVRCSAAARDPELGRMLWEKSIEATGADFRFD